MTELIAWIAVARRIRATCQNLEAFDALIAFQEIRLAELEARRGQ